MKCEKRKVAQGRVPKLRFPEFQGAGEWEEKRLGNCLLTHPEYGVNAPAVPYSESLPTYLRITDISEDGIYNANKKVSVGIDVTNENYLEDGDIVLARTGASVGKSYRYKIADGQLVFAGFLIRIRPDVSKASSVFIHYTLTSDKYWKWINMTSARSGQPGINSNEYASFPILLSHMHEQQKIADCLSSLDELITLHTQKLDSLKTRKKGSMQQLFPAEGETVPKLRFPEFQGAGEWVEKRIDEVVELISGLHLSPDEYSSDGIGVPYFSGPSDFTDNLSCNKKWTEHTGNTGICADVLITVKGSGVGTLFELKLDIVAIGRQLMAIRPMHIVGSIIYQILLLRKSHFEALGTGNMIPGLSRSDILSLKLHLPSIPEQQKIADCLSSLDELIAAQTQKLATLKTHKKGLMQGLFPSADEVNA